MTATPAAGEEIQALVRMEQERRRRAADDFVGVVVERDHRGPSAALGRLPREVLQQVGMPAVEPVEHPDDHEQPAVARVERLDALDDVHQSGRVGAPASTNTLSGASRSPCAAAIATSASPGPTSR